MPDGLYRDYGEASEEKKLAIALNGEAYERQQELLIQIAINLQHLSDITGTTAEEFLNSLGEGFENIEELLSIETGETKKWQSLKFDLETLAEYDIIDQKNPEYFDISNISSQTDDLNNQNDLLQVVIDKQIEFTLANIPKGKKLNDDQQSALYLMTSSSEEVSNNLKSQRARIGNHMSLPKIYREEAEEEIQRFHEYVFSNPEILQTYLRANREGHEMNAEERLDFARFHVVLRAELDGREAPEVFNHTFEGKDKNTAGDANYALNRIRLQEKDGWYSTVAWPEFLRVVNHEYDHFREGDEAVAARTQATNKQAMGADEIDRHNAGLVYEYNAHTYFKSREAPDIKGKTGYELYRNQPKERYAEGIGQMWKQAVLDIPAIKTMLESPENMRACISLHTLQRHADELQDCLQQDTFGSEKLQADVLKLIAMINEIDTSSAVSIDQDLDQIKEKIGQIEMPLGEITILTYELRRVSELADHSSSKLKEFIPIERAYKESLGDQFGLTSEPTSQ